MMPTTVFFPKIFKYNFPLGEEHIKDVRLSVSAMMKVKKITVAILWCMKMNLETDFIPIVILNLWKITLSHTRRRN